MARRPYFGEERSALAAWSGRLGIFALVVAALSAIVVRTGLLEIGPALATFAAALVCAALAVLLALASSIPIWRQGKTGIGRAVLGMFLGAALLAYPAYLGSRALKLPAINDITTNPADPPRFAVLARLRPRGSSDYPGAAAAAMQRQAYSVIEPLQVSATPQVAYEATLALVQKRKWRVVDALAPSPARRNGTIEAIAQTMLMGFRDDIAIRVSPAGGGAQIDMRSASRYGKHDFGANAARIVSFLSDLDDAISAMPPDRRQPAQRQPQRPPQQPRR
ncbi:MAG: DUF1499 domain-containing protein [Xanthobacteraceae bacterium]|uniref:DUF1499 domain-containing protein n=1 Tax=Pseudolabrys sp. TaxID=1960880 RepID=UPI003D1194EF